MNDSLDLALIGNCAYQALIDRRGAVRWLCWPRFDSSFVFGSLLDQERGGEFTVVPERGDFHSKQAYLPNTNIVRTEIECAAGAYEIVDFAPRFRLYDRHFKPRMLVRRVRRLSGEPRVLITCEPRDDYGRRAPERTTANHHFEWLLRERLRLTTNAPVSYLEDHKAFLLESDVYLVLTYGEPLEKPIVETCESYLDQTRRYWERWVKHTTLPGAYQQQVVRSALALKLHQYEDTGAVTAATTTSIPEHPGSGRCWDYRFCWVRDAYFTIRALRRLGHFDELENFVGFLKNVASASDDLQPLYSLTGERELVESELSHLRGFAGEGPVRVGNDAFRQRQHDVYGEMIASLAPFFLDIRFEEHCVDSTYKLVSRLLTSIELSLSQPDAGIWEIRDEPRVHTFSLLFHWVGAEVARRIFDKRGDAKRTAEAARLAGHVRTLMETQCYSEPEGFYGDAIGSRNADGALFMLVNLGYLRPSDPRAERHVRALSERLSIGGHLMRRYTHFDGIGETHGSFTVCGFWHVEALARLGFRDEAASVFERLMSHANHVGLLSEDIDPATGQQWGNFPQTYSHVGVINAAFAVRPVPVEVGEE